MANANINSNGDTVSNIIKRMPSAISELKLMAHDLDSILSGVFRKIMLEKLASLALIIEAMFNMLVAKLCSDLNIDDLDKAVSSAKHDRLKHECEQLAKDIFGVKNYMYCGKTSDVLNGMKTWREYLDPDGITDEDIPAMCAQLNEMSKERNRQIMSEQLTNDVKVAAVSKVKKPRSKSKLKKSASVKTKETKETEETNENTSIE